MTLNDPLSRNSRRRRRADIDGPAVLRRVRRRIVRTASLTLATGALAVTALPSLSPWSADPWLAVAALLALWLGVCLLQTRVHPERYLHEKCRGPNV